jgi:Transglycosylase-like domain
MDYGSGRTAGYRGKAQGAGGGHRGRPGRAALSALLLAIGALLAAAAVAQAGSGGIDATGATGDGSKSVDQSRYTRIWQSYSAADHRWAHKTSYCESGENPRAVALGGSYRGAFMFTRPAWRGAPKSPGGDPIKYSWRTQAVVAVALKHQLGTKPWPVCG